MPTPPKTNPGSPERRKAEAVMVSIMQRALSWPLVTPTLRGTAIQIWSARLSGLAAHGDALGCLLSDAERRRAESYKATSHQRRYCLVRGTLRSLLGSYLHCDPTRVRITEGPEGKPQLAEDAAGSLHFNLSHSGDLAVFGFCADAQVGVDIEHLDASVDADVVANTAFSADELASYRAARDDQRLEHFFRLWTRKEARVKAAGLAMAHRYFEPAGRLPVADLTLAADYVGAVAVCDPR